MESHLFNLLQLAQYKIYLLYMSLFQWDWIKPKLVLFFDLLMDIVGDKCLKRWTLGLILCSSGTNLNIANIKGKMKEKNFEM